MNSRISRESESSRSIFSLAGWLFADLLLALSMIFLIADTKMLPASVTNLPTLTYTPTHTLHPSITPTITYTPSKTPPPTETPTPTPTITLTPTQKHTQGPIGLGQAQCYNIKLSSTNIYEDEVVRLLSRQIPNDSKYRAGLVMVWSNGGSGDGVAMSRAVKQILTKNFQESFGDAVIKSLFFNMESDYFVQLEVYFFTDAVWKSGAEKNCLYKQ